MKKLLLIIIIAATTNAIHSQALDPEDVEVGFVERLGDILPLDLEFLNEGNDTVTLGELIDKPTILSFVYFDCPGLCSPLMDGISEAVSKLDMKLGEEYQLITISFNTTDTPEKAKTKKQNFVQQIKGEDRKYWIYLTGWQENITAITEAAGFRYKPRGVDFDHPSGVILISPSGKITRYLYGISFLPFDLKMAIIESQKEIARPTINKVLEFCFSYDPVGRTYTLQITRIIGAIIIFFAVVVFAGLLIRGRRKNIK
jgi:protein SCO1/2